MQHAQNTEQITTKNPLPRREVLDALESHGLVMAEFDSLSIDGLSELLQGVKNIMTSRTENNYVPKTGKREEHYFSTTDKKIVRKLISSSGRVSSLLLSRELEIPLTTVQRRRKKLEDEFIEAFYSLKVEKLGWRKATMFVSVSHGDFLVAGKELLESSDLIISVSRIIGVRAADFKAEIIFRDNSDLSKLIDQVKSLPHVQDISWSETVREVGRKDYPDAVLDSSQS